MSARILIVEDDDVVRGLLIDHLSGAGFTVSPVETGEAAIAALKAEPGAFAAIVCDVQLPGMSGPEALAAADDAILGPAGIVFLSGLGSALGVEMPGRRVVRLSKPFDPAGLIAAVKTVSG